MKKCVFAGTFDPFTVGHHDVVEKCLEMFDGVIIAVLENANKAPMFSKEDRLGFIKKLYENEERVTVKSSDKLLVDFMREEGVNVNVRGLRNSDDYKYETEMHYFNSDMYPELITVYLPAPKDVMYVSSTALRSLMRANADISSYVPEKIAKDVKKALINK